MIPGYKIYGTDSALSVELSLTMPSDRFKKGQHTLSFEMAEFSGARSQQGAQWDRKIVLQATITELPQVIAVVSGYKDEVEFKFHGKDRNKSYKVTQTSLSVSAPGRSHSVQMAPHDRFQICSLAMKQLQRSHGALSSDVLYRMIGDCYTQR